MTTQLKQTQQQIMNAFTSNSNPGKQLSTPSSKAGCKRKPKIDDWRMNKKCGPKVKRNGKLWYWCEHHKYPGYYDGLYVTHPPEKHSE